MQTIPKRKSIVSVRPTRDGKWETVETTPLENEIWRRQHERWYAEYGHKLQQEHPDWWR